jgi:hypothetical protein
MMSKQFEILARWGGISAVFAAAFTLSAQVQPYDLRTGGSLQKDGVLFFPGQAAYYTAQSTGTGVFDPFLTYQASPTEAGYNGDPNDNLMSNVSTGGSKTQRVLISDLANSQITLAGINYYFISADLNENNSRPGSFISIDQLQLFVRSTPYVAAGATDALRLSGLQSSSTLVWDLDKDGTTTAHDREIYLDTLSSAGSGRADGFMLIPKAMLDPYPSSYYFYLFAQHGLSTFPNMTTDSGFEEWDLINQTIGGFTFDPPPPTPEASTVAALGLLGVAAAGQFVRQRRLALS